MDATSITMICTARRIKNGQVHIYACITEVRV